MKTLLLLCLVALASASDAGVQIAAQTGVTPADTVAVGVLGTLLALVPAKYLAALGVFWTVVTALGAMLGIAAAAVRSLRGADSKAAFILDSMSHWLSLLGTSFRPSQAEASPFPPMPPKAG